MLKILTCMGGLTSIALRFWVPSGDCFGARHHNHVPLPATAGAAATWQHVPLPCRQPSNHIVCPPTLNCGRTFFVSSRPPASAPACARAGGRAKVGSSGSAGRQSHSAIRCKMPSSRRSSRGVSAAPAGPKPLCRSAASGAAWRSHRQRMRRGGPGKGVPHAWICQWGCHPDPSAAAAAAGVAPCSSAREAAQTLAPPLDQSTGTGASRA